jgi:hypothetical protein
MIQNTAPARSPAALHELRFGFKFTTQGTQPCKGYGHSILRRPIVLRRHFGTGAELERQMAAARQLRAETLRGATCMLNAVAATIGRLQRKLLRAPPPPRRVLVMKPLTTDQAMWLARGVALGLVVRLLQLGLRPAVRRLRAIGLAPRLLSLGRKRLLEG